MDKEKTLMASRRGQTVPSHLKAILTEALEAGIAVTGADYGNIQCLNAQGTGLVIVVQRGFDRAFLEHFKCVPIKEATALCGRAALSGERCMVRDVETDPAFRPHLAIARSVPFRAVQSTPILGSQGELLGILSTHYRQPRLPDKTCLEKLDLWVLQARRAIEALRTSQALPGEGLDRMESSLSPSLGTLTLGAFDVFQDLPAGQLAAIQEKMTEKNYAKGALLYSEGEPADQVWFLAKGLISAVRSNPDRNIVVRLTIPFNMFGTGGGSVQETYLTTTTAETEVRAFCIPQADFRALMIRHPVVAQGFARHLSRLLRASLRNMEMNLSTVESRLIYVLHHLYQYFGLRVPLTRDQFARFANTSLETCVRSFKSLEKKGMVRTGRGRIEVVDPKRLSDFLDNF